MTDRLLAAVGIGQAAMHVHVNIVIWHAMSRMPRRNAYVAAPRPMIVSQRETGKTGEFKVFAIRFLLPWAIPPFGLRNVRFHRIAIQSGSIPSSTAKLMQTSISAVEEAPRAFARNNPSANRSARF